MTENRGRITTIPVNRVERREEARLTCWVGREEHANPTLTGLSSLAHESQADGVPLSASEPILVLCDADQSAATQALLAHGEAGKRVYVLASASWGQGVDPRVLRCPKVLVRRVARVPTTGIHTPEGAWLWLGGSLDGPTPWRLRLDLAQAEAFRQLFVRLFWHDARDEAWSTGQALAFHPAGQRPFDVPVPNPTLPLRLSPVDSRLDADGTAALVYQADKVPPAGRPRRLWLPPSGEHHDRLEQLIRQDASVRWTDFGLPDLVLGSRRNRARLPGAAGRLDIDLNTEQSADFGRILEQSPTWSFGAELRLGDHADTGDKLWLAGAGAARHVETKQTIPLPDIRADRLRGAESVVPDVWPASDPLALSVQYSWTIVPPRVPRGSAEDPLIERWRAIDDDWKARLENVADLLKTAGGQRNRVRERFARLAGNVLGFEKAADRLTSEVAILVERRPSAAGPEEASVMLLRLADVEKETHALGSELEKTERSAQEEDERNKQEEVWSASRALAAEAVAANTRVLQEKEFELHRIQAEKGEVESAPRPSDPAKARDAEALKKRLWDDMKRSEKEVKDLKAVVAAKQREADAPFAFQPPSKPSAKSPSAGPRFVPAIEPLPLRAPVEALPAVGLLRNHQGRRYLVIGSWQELDVGESEATRLKAQLVAPEDA